ncbi:MAG: hypothetical protein KY464_05975 [Gemmatimonadetes bacterium]|nr:hypothetical protein [Gemmatimonadota bacterium]
MTPHVVIVSGGFGGLYGARALRRAPVGPEGGGGWIERDPARAAAGTR